MPKYTHRRRNKGGKPVFAGAQGCVFVPSLKCKHRPRNANDGNISKLGYKEGSEFEMREYEKIAPFLKKIKNHEKYFNIRASLCEPDALTTSDLVDFNNVCKNFKEDINASNVNSKLDKLRTINMPDLGIDLKVWIEKAPLNAQRLRHLNNHLSELLVHAVVPMNQQGVMHNDLKSENIMMDKNDANMRIIDWGLAGISTSYQLIPGRYFMNNPVTFNRPFSTMIISSEIDNLYAKFTAGAESIEVFMKELYKEYRKLAPTGHEYLTYIFETMFNLKPEAAEVALKSAVENYAAEILQHFTDPMRKKFKLNEYFDKVYRYNTDVWGVMSVFYTIFMLPRDHFSMTNAIYYDMLHRYRSLFRTVVFVNGHKRMNVQDIVHQLRQINDAVMMPKNSNKSIKKKVKFNIGANEGDHAHRYRIPTPHPLKWLH
jgi:hypothetical protein